ncbi:hypothetical protein [Mesorhizobium sp. B2-4-8]|uniref:hypothetical protein n=1 Tax=Mesorhizobium sp. B2-4-8 TaxID=2589941 RepID=UPI00112C1DB5|nr:hypothetical protein [Mesorhizobium sp. B2-4-8]TPL36730.1 hypothetical protein FJ947_10770 [Mesorhizobium sp. B2-4-8]
MQFKPTFDFVTYRVTKVDLTDEADGYREIRVTCVGGQRFVGHSVFNFIFDARNPRRPIPRFSALCAAAGGGFKIDDFDQLIGRYFCVKEDGNNANDFASVTYAAQCLASDRKAFVEASAYAAKCAAEEAAEASGFADAA